MKKLPIFSIIIVSLLSISMMTSCTKKEELVKTISSDALSFSGTHKGLLKVDADSVKIMLICIDEENDRWQVRALVPFKNTMPWKDVPNTEEPSSKTGGKYYLPKMNLKIVYLDQYGSELSLELGYDSDVLTSILSSNEYTSENLLIKHLYEYLSPSEYDKCKSIYEKVTSIAFKNVSLYEETITPEVESTYSTSSTNKQNTYEKAIDAIDETYGKVIDAAIETYEDVIDDAVEAYEDAFDEAVDAYEDALEDLFGF